MLPSIARVSATLALIAAPALATQAGTDLDLSVFTIQINQAIQTGNTTLVGGKTTILRAPLAVAGTFEAGAVVDGLLRVYQNGVELPTSPIYSVNGPIAVNPSPLPANIDDTLNFNFVAPEGAGYEFVVEVNPSGPGQLAEVDYSNNSLSTGTVDFACVGVPDVVWVPIDYRPGGGSTPNLPDPELIKPGVGDNFFTGVMPGSDVEYRRSAMPSKLWTGSLSGSGSSLNSSLLQDLQMMVPQPDFIYGWVPGSLPYNGQAIGIPGQAAMGNTDPVRYQRTMAHEVGHLIGLSHTNDKIDNFGVDVEHQLNIPLGLGQVMGPSKNDIMVAGQITSSAWVDQGTYNQAINHPAWNCAGDWADAGEPDGPANARRMMISGIVRDGAERGELTGVVSFSGGVPTEGVAPEAANVLLRVLGSEQVLHELPLSVHSSADHCGECRAAAGDSDAAFEAPEAAFVVVLPASVKPATVDRIELVRADGSTLDVIEASANGPSLELTSPRPGEPLGPEVLLAWKAEDADGDALSFTVRYSPDGERMVPVVSHFTGSEFLVPLAQLPAPVVGQAFIEILASDGLRTERVATERLGFGGLLGYAAGGNAPFCHVMTPDSGKSFPFGATVLLHGSGHDLEDGKLDGTDLSWVSDLDGKIAQGRVSSVADLSVGTHTLTLIATDSSGNQTLDTTVITITPRTLPGDVTCQTDLGFGGPGSAVLAVCGGDLSSGTTADIKLTGAAPNATLFLAVGATNAPTALFGGTVVPVPALVVLVDQTDLTGGWTLNGISGGGGPSTYFLQALYLDAAQTDGLGISNAVQVDFLP
jgi:hypothetical protein